METLIEPLSYAFFQKGLIVAAQNKISMKFVYNKKNDETGKWEKDNSAMTVISTNISLLK